MALSKTAKIMILSAAGICLLMLIIGLIVINFVIEFEKSAAYATGIAAGCLLTAVKIVMLEKAINTSLDMGTKIKAGATGTLLFAMRFALTGAVLFVAFRFPAVLGRFGTIFGIISMQLSAYTSNFILMKIQPDNFDNLNDLSGDYDEKDEDDDDGDEGEDRENEEEEENI